MTFSLYDKLAMVENRVKTKSMQRDLLWAKAAEEGILYEELPDHEYFNEISRLGLMINHLMVERNTLMDTIKNDII